MRCVLRLDPCISWFVQVDFNAKNDYEYINNYKILQAAFTKLGIDKVSCSVFGRSGFYHCQTRQALTQAPFVLCSTLR